MIGRNTPSLWPRPVPQRSKNRPPAALGQLGLRNSVCLATWAVMSSRKVALVALSPLSCKPKELLQCP